MKRNAKEILKEKLLKNKYQNTKQNYNHKSKNKRKSKNKYSKDKRKTKIKDKNKEIRKRNRPLMPVGYLPILWNIQGKAI